MNTRMIRTMALGLFLGVIGGALVGWGFESAIRDVEPVSPGSVVLLLAVLLGIAGLGIGWLFYRRWIRNVAKAKEKGEDPPMNPEKDLLIFVGAFVVVAIAWVLCNLLWIDTAARNY